MNKLNNEFIYTMLKDVEGDISWYALHSKPYFFHKDKAFLFNDMFISGLAFIYTDVSVVKLNKNGEAFLKEVDTLEKAKALDAAAENDLELIKFNVEFVELPEPFNDAVALKVSSYIDYYILERQYLKVKFKKRNAPEAKTYYDTKKQVHIFYSEKELKDYLNSLKDLMHLYKNDKEHGGFFFTPTKSPGTITHALKDMSWLYETKEQSLIRRVREDAAKEVVKKTFTEEKKIKLPTKTLKVLGVFILTLLAAAVFLLVA
jgi:hypothetical protein